MDQNQKIEQQKETIAKLVLEVAAEKQRADQQQEEARKAVAFVQAEQQRYEALAQELAAAKAAIPAQTGMPFLYAIMAPDGHAHIDECCVAGSPEGLYPELNCLNDSPDTGYTIVPLYAAPPVQQPAPVGYTRDTTPELLAENPDTSMRIYGKAMPERGVTLAVFAAPVAAPVAGQEPFATISSIPDCHGPNTMAVIHWNGTREFTQADKGMQLFSAPVPAASAQPTDDLVKRLTHERDALGQAISDAALKAGMYNGEVPLNGPHLIMFAQHLGEAAAQQPDSGRDAALERLPRYSPIAVQNNGYEWNAEMQLEENNPPAGDYVRYEDVAELFAAHPASVAQPVSDAAQLHARLDEWRNANPANVAQVEKSSTDAALVEAMANVRAAVEVNDGDSLGCLTDNANVLWVASGSWTGCRAVTLGDLRVIAEYGPAHLHPIYPKDTIKILQSVIEAKRKTIAEMESKIARPGDDNPIGYINLDSLDFLRCCIEQDWAAENEDASIPDGFTFIFCKKRASEGNIPLYTRQQPHAIAQVGELSEEFTLALDRAIDNLTRVDESDTVQLRDAHEAFHALYRSVQVQVGLKIKDELESMTRYHLQPSVHKGFEFFSLEDDSAGEYVKIADVAEIIDAMSANVTQVGELSDASADPVVESNVALMRKRSSIGIKQYGTTLADSGLPIRDLLVHALEESLDMANYIQAVIHQTDAMSAPAKSDNE